MSKDSGPDLLARLTEGDDNMYRLLSYFLLLDPKRQIQQLGGTEGLLTQAETALKRGYPTRARTYFETLAKVGIFNGDETIVRRMLARAEETISNPNTNTNTNQHLYQELISNLQRVMSIAKSFYERADTA